MSTGSAGPLAGIRAAIETQRVPGATASPSAPPLGVLPLAQAACVYSRSHIRAQLDAGRWQRPARKVLVLHNGPLTYEQRLWVALLASPKGSALGGITAATADDLQGFTDAPTVVIPDGARRPQLDWVKVWRSTQLSAADVHPLRQPRRTRLPRSVVDAAADDGPPNRARALILASCQQRLVVPAHLRDALSRRGNCRHRPLIAESIDDAQGGVQSLPEREFDLIWRCRHLPPPTRQAVLRRGDGRYYLDRRWERFGLACEIQGMPHLDVAQWDDDLDRQNEIVILGPRLLFFTSYAVRHLSDRVGDQLERALIRGGFQP